MSDIVVKKFTFAISSPGEFLSTKFRNHKQRYEDIAVNRRIAAIHFTFGQKLQIFPILRVFGALVGRDSIGISSSLVSEVPALLHDDMMFSSFARTPTCDGYTHGDRRTDRVVAYRPTALS